MSGDTPPRTGAPRRELELAVEHDAGLARRAAIGLLALATDQTVEHDLRRVVRGSGVALYATRVPNVDDISAATLQAMTPHLSASAAMLVPGVPLAAVGFACTSGGVLIGEDGVAAAVHRVRPGVPVTMPITAAKAGLGALGVRRIALIVPYADDIVARLIAHLEDSGVEVAVVGRLRQYTDTDACRVAPRSLYRAAVEAGRLGAVDGVFVSCTSLRFMDVIAACEAELGIPVLCSNQALAWHLLHLAGVGIRRDGPGRLFACSPVPADRR